jgi:hypothetical protein
MDHQSQTAVHSAQVMVQCKIGRDECPWDRGPLVPNYETQARLQACSCERRTYVGRSRIELRELGILCESSRQDRPAHYK